jgi:hypothetical protein
MFLMHLPAAGVISVRGFFVAARELAQPSDTLSETLEPVGGSKEANLWKSTQQN